VLRAIALCAVVTLGATRPVSGQGPSTTSDSAKPTDRPKPIGSAQPFAAWSDSAHAFRDSLVAMVRAQIGTPYRHGGQSPEGGFDCSGLVQYVMGALRLELPRTAAQQARAGYAVERDTSRLRPGDLLTFGKSGREVSHVGIYVGDGRYVHASSTARQVIESRIARPPSPLIKSWRGSRRMTFDPEIASDSTSVRLGGR
jgi:cell wall-associated NlpC family hydrolase